MLEISADILNKSNISGGQGPFIELPDAIADPKILITGRDQRFVEYLRWNMIWGGFPGFSFVVDPEERRRFETSFSYKAKPIPHQTIAYLTKDLISF